MIAVLRYRRTRTGGRNSTGQITVRGRIGSAARRGTTINFTRRFTNVLGHVIAFSHDATRTAPVALIGYRNWGLVEYVLAAHGVGLTARVVVSATRTHPNVVNWLRGAPVTNSSFCLFSLPVGSYVYNIEHATAGVCKYTRAAGTASRILQKLRVAATVWVAVRLRSGAARYILGGARASVGQAGNVSHWAVSLRQAGRHRRLGFRSTVRGVAMNPVDHPHGGGEGKTSGGRPSVSAWGRLTKGPKTTRRPVLYARRRLLHRLRRGTSY